VGERLIVLGYCSPGLIKETRDRWDNVYRIRWVGGLGSLRDMGGSGGIMFW